MIGELTTSSCIPTKGAGRMVVRWMIPSRWCKSAEGRGDRSPLEFGGGRISNMPCHAAAMRVEPHMARHITAL